MRRIRVATTTSSSGRLTLLRRWKLKKVTHPIYIFKVEAKYSKKNNLSSERSSSQLAIEHDVPARFTPLGWIGEVEQETLLHIHGGLCCCYHQRGLRLHGVMEESDTKYRPSQDSFTFHEPSSRYTLFHPFQDHCQLCAPLCLQALHQGGTVPTYLSHFLGFAYSFWLWCVSILTCSYCLLWIFFLSGFCLHFYLI